MKKGVRPSAFAKAEIEYYLVRYESESASLRDRLWDDIEAVIDLISEYPSIGELVRRTRGPRASVPAATLFFVIYRERGDDLQIVALAHKRRKPTYWRPRLKFN